MSGFSPEWLALREPADIAARSRLVLTACQRHFSTREGLAICDIGTGTGASVRALASVLPRTQQWTLIDHDAGNLAEAQRQLAAWKLDLRQPIDVRTSVYDFAKKPDCWPEDTELVTASALFDLVSAAWIAQFVEALAARRLPLLATLTVDGNIANHPGQKFDDAIYAALRVHQSRDKGFGPSVGGAAPLELERALVAAGYKIVADESPWRIDRTQSGLLLAFFAGIAGAVHETGLLPAADIEQWLRAVVIETTTLTVGHRDVFAVPS